MTEGRQQETAPKESAGHPLHLLFITHYFWPESSRLNDMVAGLVERGHRVTVLTGIPNYPGGKYYDGYGAFRRLREQYEGAEVIRVPMIPRARGRSWNLILNYFSSAISASVRAATLARRDWDVIFVFQPSPITTGIPARALRALRPTPVFLWVQDVWPETLSAVGAIKSPALLRHVESLVRWVYLGTDRILIQSEAFRASVARVVPRYADRIVYYPNYAEAIYRPVAPEQLEGDPTLPDGFRITFAGNIGIAQDFGTILDAAERLREDRDIHWVIAGDGSMKPWVESEIAKRGLVGQVHLIGHLPMDRMPRLFARSDALLVTLKREPVFALTIPSKVQSYLACGRPVIAGLDGEGARVVEDAHAGVTCGAEDPLALAEAVARLKALPPAELERMGMRARQYFEEHFEREGLLNKLELWLYEAAAGGPGKRPVRNAGTGNARPSMTRGYGR